MVQTSLVHFAREAISYYSKSEVDLRSLLTVVLSGTKITHEIIDRLCFCGVKKLSQMSVQDLVTDGLSKSAAVRIVAAFGLATRMEYSRAECLTTIRSPQDVSSLVMEEIRYLQKEYFICLYLNTKNHLIGKETLSIGSLNASIVHPREVFLSAIKRSSASIICVHNHPSGDPTPSSEDVEITRRLIDAGKIIGISLLDHIIIGDGRFVSLTEQGLM